MTLADLQDLNLSLELKISHGYLRVALTAKAEGQKPVTLASDSVSLSELREELGESDL